jgi:hypothetical protein
MGNEATLHSYLCKIKIAKSPNAQGMNTALKLGNID